MASKSNSSMRSPRASSRKSAPGAPKASRSRRAASKDDSKSPRKALFQSRTREMVNPETRADEILSELHGLGVYVHQLDDVLRYEDLKQLYSDFKDAHLEDDARRSHAGKTFSKMNKRDLTEALALKLGVLFEADREHLLEEILRLVHERHDDKKSRSRSKNGSKDSAASRSKNSRSKNSRSNSKSPSRAQSKNSAGSRSKSPNSRSRAQSARSPGSREDNSVLGEMFPGADMNESPTRLRRSASPRRSVARVEDDSLEAPLMTSRLRSPRRV